MSSNRFLEYELAILLAQYGKEAVLAALARKLGQSPTELEASLRDIEKEEPKPRRIRNASAKDPLEAVVTQHPDKADQLRIVAGLFQNRLFLPELRDVKRFFDQHSQNLGRAKSRQACFAKLLKLLSELSSAELSALVTPHGGSEYSSLGVISDEILRRDK